MEDEVCKFQKNGFWKFKEVCIKKHFIKLCDSLSGCKEIKHCQKRHPKNCLTSFTPTSRLNCVTNFASTCRVPCVTSFTPSSIVPYVTSFTPTSRVPCVTIFTPTSKSCIQTSMGVVWSLLHSRNQKDRRKIQIRRIKWRMKFVCSKNIDFASSRNAEKPTLHRIIWQFIRMQRNKTLSRETSRELSNKFCCYIQGVLCN